MVARRNLIAAEEQRRLEAGEEPLWFDLEPGDPVDVYPSKYKKQAKDADRWKGPFVFMRYGDKGTIMYRDPYGTEKTANIERVRPSLKVHTARSLRQGAMEFSPKDFKVTDNITTHPPVDVDISREIEDIVDEKYPRDDSMPTPTQAKAPEYIDDFEKDEGDTDPDARIDDTPVLEVIPPRRSGRERSAPDRLSFHFRVLKRDANSPSFYDRPGVTPDHSDHELDQTEPTPLSKEEMTEGRRSVLPHGLWDRGQEVQAAWDTLMNRWIYKRERRKSVEA